MEPNVTARKYECLLCVCCFYTGLHTGLGLTGALLFVQTCHRSTRLLYLAPAQTQAQPPHPYLLLIYDIHSRTLYKYAHT